MSIDKELRKEEKAEPLKPDLKDFIALTIALLETTLRPFLFLAFAFFVIYLTILTISIAGPLWLIGVYVPLTALVVVLRRFIHWRRLEKAKASFK